jgi:uncharacterized protein YdhG (YjbR/CyaY superfamily)
MRKKATAIRGGNQGAKIPKTIGEYIAGVPEPARPMLTRIRALIQTAAPKEAVETISYGMPAFKYKGMLVWFAAFSNHCSLFPGSTIIELFKKDLKSFSTTKGTIHFPMDKPVPATLIKRIVKAKVAENEKRKRR